MTVKIAAFAGSSRQGSFNQRILRIAIRAAEAAGAEVELIDLKQLDLPLMDQDLEAAHGLPEGAKRFKQALMRADALLIATPEYNSSYPPLLKNAIDWATRREGSQEKPLAAFAGKPACLLSASPGALGGLRALFALRALLQNIQVLVLPNMVASPSLGDASFDNNGALQDAAAQNQIESATRALVAMTTRVTPGAEA
jgi:chromate reductase, NAD(P)H dehydrogenase (quinone)